MVHSVKPFLFDESSQGTFLLKIYLFFQGPRRVRGWAQAPPPPPPPRTYQRTKGSLPDPFVHTEILLSCCLHGAHLVSDLTEALSGRSASGRSPQWSVGRISVAQTEKVTLKTTWYSHFIFKCTLAQQYHKGLHDRACVFLRSALNTCHCEYWLLTYWLNRSYTEWNIWHNYMIMWNN